jgi:rubrerythrin
MSIPITENEAFELLRDGLIKIKDIKRNVFKPKIVIWYCECCHEMTVQFIDNDPPASCSHCGAN